MGGGFNSIPSYVPIPKRLGSCISVRPVNTEFKLSAFDRLMLMLCNKNHKNDHTEYYRGLLPPRVIERGRSERVPRRLEDLQGNGS